MEEQGEGQDQDYQNRGGDRYNDYYGRGRNRGNYYEDNQNFHDDQAENTRFPRSKSQKRMVAVYYVKKGEQEPKNEDFEKPEQRIREPRDRESRIYEQRNREPKERKQEQRHQENENYEAKNRAPKNFKKHASEEYPKKGKFDRVVYVKKNKSQTTEEGQTPKVEKDGLHNQPLPEHDREDSDSEVGHGWKNDDDTEVEYTRGRGTRTEAAKANANVPSKPEEKPQNVAKEQVKQESKPANTNTNTRTNNTQQRNPQETGSSGTQNAGASHYNEHNIQEFFNKSGK